jgi:hypothetical protein
VTTKVTTKNGLLQKNDKGQNAELPKRLERLLDTPNSMIQMLVRSLVICAASQLIYSFDVHMMNLANGKWFVASVGRLRVVELWTEMRSIHIIVMEACGRIYEDNNVWRSQSRPRFLA